MQTGFFTKQQWQGILKWSLYGLLFFFSLLLQSSVLPRMPVGGVYLSSLPVCMACVAVREGKDKSTLYALLCSIFYALSGAIYGPLFIVTLTFSAALSGALCDRYYTKSFLSSMILSLMSLAICLGVAFIARVYLGAVSPIYWRTVLIPEIILSVLVVPIHSLCAWAISKIGG